MEIEEANSRVVRCRRIRINGGGLGVLYLGDVGIGGTCL